MDTLNTKPKVTPKDFFLWLGAMVALYISATSLILLIHQYINVLFPNTLEYGGATSYYGSIRFSIAFLVVVFPLYLWLTRLLHTDIRKVPEKRELWVRRWLVFITLFVAGFTIASDLVALIYTFLEGELTTRFSLKALTILVVLGGGFWYYLLELRGVWDVKENLSKTIGGVVSVLVLGAIAAGFLIVGSPMTQRLIQLDLKKEQDLQSIQSQVLSFWQMKQKLPTDLTELNNPFSYYVVPVDSETGKPYGYTVTGPLTFQICADFHAASVATPGVTQPITPGYENDTWKHEAGAQCFTRTIDTDIYQPIPKQSLAPTAR